MPISHFCVLEEPLVRLPATRSIAGPFADILRAKGLELRRGRTSMWKNSPPPRAPGFARVRDDMDRDVPRAILMFCRAAADV